MKEPNALKKILQTASLDIEKILSYELDNFTFPTHQFSTSYQKRKLQNLRTIEMKKAMPYLKWRIFFMIMILLVILLYCIEYLKIKK